jgi:hypothetical protein
MSQWSYAQQVIYISAGHFRLDDIDGPWEKLHFGLDLLHFSATLPVLVVGTLFSIQNLNIHLSNKVKCCTFENRIRTNQSKAIAVLDRKAHESEPRNIKCPQQVSYYRHASAISRD